MLEKYMSACIVKLVLRYHTCILPPSYFINRFSILGTFLLLCFYLSFSFLQFFLIYNLKLNLYIKSTKTTTISRLKLHWQAQLSNAEDIEVRMPLFLFWFLCYIKQIYSMLNYFYCRTYQNVVRTSFGDVLCYCLVFHTLFLPHFDAICDQLLNRRIVPVIWKLFDDE